jgi:hypothetical protein
MDMVIMSAELAAEQRKTAMTTITYRGSDRTISSSEGHFDVANYARSLLSAWRRWQTARELEAMPFDIRKDIGWPSADDSKHETK